MTTKAKRRKALATLPTTPYDSFRSIITRIRECPHAELGIQVLMWIHFAHRPLKLRELQHALAVELGDTELDEDNIHPRKALLDSCFGLVVIDDETMTVRFMHFTLEEYFRNNATIEFPGGHSPIAETCLTYLNFGELRQHFTTSQSHILHENREKYAFLDYASLYWGTYVEQPYNNNIKKLITAIVEHESERPPCSIQALYLEIDQTPSWRKTISTKFSGIHVIAYFGLSELMANFCQVELKDDCGLTPLSWAAFKGHETIVRLLIGKYGIDINAKDDERRTPLIWAARHGYEAVVRLLIEKDGIDINAKDDEGATPLILAAINGSEAIVRLLIGKDGIDINAMSTWGTPLIWAARNGHEAVVRLLIGKDGIDINAKDNRGATPLTWAARNGHEAVVQLLVKKEGVDIGAKDNEGNTAFTWAARNGHKFVVRLLIGKDGIDINAKDN